MAPAAPAPAPEAALPPGFAPLIARLDAPSRQHLLYFRIAVSRAVLKELYQGDVEALPDTSPTKENSLREFAGERRDRLADLGLNEAQLRQPIEAHLVVAHLPAEVVRQLRFTHLVYLSQVADPATRRLLAGAAVDNAQSGAELRDACEARPPARVVNRVEKGVPAFAEATAAWSDLPAEALTAPQRARRAGASRAGGDGVGEATAAGVTGRGAQAGGWADRLDGLRPVPGPASLGERTGRQGIAPGRTVACPLGRLSASPRELVYGSKAPPGPGRQEWEQDAQES